MKNSKIINAINQSKIIADRIKINPVWRQFKAKWDNRIPRKNSKLFAEYAADANRAQESNQQITNEVLGV